jgi:hypothetical protein
LLYEKAFGKNVVVGIISVPNPDYDVRHWWRYSDGVREVLSESVGYVYARLFFYPSRSLGEKTAVSRRKGSPAVDKDSYGQTAIPGQALRCYCKSFLLTVSSTPKRDLD